MVYRVVLYRFSKWICVEEKLGRFSLPVGDLKIIFYEYF